jgi:hypothetical protein
MHTSNRKYIVSPILDFILLGGGSLILFPLILYMWPPAYIRAHKLYPIFITIAVFFSYAVNFPHFSYSYQIMYKDFFKKLSGAIDKPLQKLYIWVSIVVPVLLAVLAVFCYFKHDFLLFGFLGNIGLLINGWHFAKQGFGVLIVTSAYQKVYFTAWERRVLLWNANIFWVYSWIMINTSLHRLSFWHARVYTLMFPQEIRKVFFYLVCLGALCSIFVIIRKYIRESVFPPVSGIVGYGTALYFWLVLLDRAPNHFHPIIFLVPSMHAIQYITIVFRMKHNEAEQSKMTGLSLAVFICLGFVLGYISFNAVPVMLDKTFNGHGPFYESILFTVMFAVFINIHHFFIDNVIWRKENSEVKNYLYGVH